MQVEHKTEKGTILFIKVAPDASNFRISKGFPDTPKGDLSYDTKENVWQTGDAIIDEGFNLIGLTSEFTEEQASKMVDNLDGYGLFFKDANGRSGHRLAQSAFKSLMQHLQVYEVNPHDEDKLVMTFLNNHKNRWEYAQERTGKWVVLFKPNEK